MISGPLKRWTMLHLAALSVAIGGCDDTSAGDKATYAKVGDAVAAIVPLSSLDPNEGVQTVTSGLTQAADSADSPAAKALSAGIAATVDQAAAYAGMLKLKRQQDLVRRTLVELQGLTSLINSSNAYAVGYGMGDPKQAIGTLSSNISSMQGNAQNPTWGSAEKPSIPTLAAVKQETARLQGELEQKQQQLADLTKQRDELAANAEVQLKQAESLKGDAGLKAFAEASETRRKSEDLTVNMELVQVQIDRLKSDLALSQAQGDAVNTGIEQLQQQAKGLEADWIGQQKSAAKQKQVAANTAAGEKPGDYSIKSVADTLTKQLGELAQIRSATLQQLEEGRKYAELASTQAASFASSIATQSGQGGKSAETYRALRQSVHQQMYQYRLGVIQRDAGSLAASEATLLGNVKASVDAAKAALTSASVQSPDELEKIDTSAVDQLSKDAVEKLKESNDTLTNVETGDSPEPLKVAAKQARLLTLHSYIQVLNAKAAAGDAEAANLAKETQTNALALRDELAAGNHPLPPVPGELGKAPPPATQPAQ